jgi:hypothetical protein
MKNIEGKSSYHSMVKDTSDEMKHAAANQEQLLHGAPFLWREKRGS